MSNSKSDTKDLLHKFRQEHRSVMNLISKGRSVSGFDAVLPRLFGASPNVRQRRIVRIGTASFFYSGHKQNIVAFMPVGWQKAFDILGRRFPGCENWWSGYPLIITMQMKIGEGTAGTLEINPEVGPVSDAKLRAEIIEAITLSASDKRMDRVHFLPGASDPGRLYSRFLRHNSTTIADVSDVDEIDKSFRQIVEAFKPEMELISSVIPTLALTLPR